MGNPNNPTRCPMFKATYDACEELTRTFSSIWRIYAGLIKLYDDTTDFYRNKPDASNEEAEQKILGGRPIQGLDLKHLATKSSLEDSEQYIARMLLINSIAIFDEWVENFVRATILEDTSETTQTNWAVITPNKPTSSQIEKAFKSGCFEVYTSVLELERPSKLADAFSCIEHRQDKYLESLHSIFKYFKHCRNCCAHGDKTFNDKCEESYRILKSISPKDCGMDEVPAFAPSHKGDELILILRGVVGFTHVLIRIMKHFDALATQYLAVENELKQEVLPRFIESKKKSHKFKEGMIEKLLARTHHCPPQAGRAIDIYEFLEEEASKK